MSNTEIRFLNLEDPLEIRFRNLAHWEQWGRIQFVTLRLNDSLPQERIDELRKMKEQCAQHKIKFSSLKITAIYNKYVDEGYGSCILAKSNVRKKLEEILHYHDEIKYVIWSYIIMPNHIHLLISPKDNLENIMKNIISYSTKQINRLLNTSGSLWQKEPMDRMPRNAVTLVHYYNYIKANPKYLKESDYAYYERPGFRELLLKFISQDPKEFEPLL